MKRISLILCLMLLPLAAGCAQNHFNLPKEEMVERVKVLGVAPIIVDADSDIRFPQKEELLTLLAANNRVHERHLVRLLKNTDSFYAVTMIDDDPKALLANLLQRRERRDDAAIQYNKYFWKEEALQAYLRKNSLDALLLVVISGITRPEKIYAATMLDSLESSYNYLIMTAQIVDSRGVILWEYPNFRRKVLSFQPLLNLQYPDFEEAKANLSGTIQVKFKTMDGVRRALDKRRVDLLRRETGDADLYLSQFEEMVSLISLDRTTRPAAPPAPAPAVAPPPAQPGAPAAPLKEPGR